MTETETAPSPKLPRYQKVADRLTELIDAGTFPPGSRIPSLRRISQQMSISLTTAMEAYRVLEDRGLVEPRPQSGYYVKCRRSLPPPPRKTEGAPRPVTLEITDLILRMLRHSAKADIVSFGAAVPHASFLPTEALNRILAREVRNHPATSQGYDTVRGFLKLREQVSRRALDAGCTLSPEEIVTTNGAHQGAYLALRAVTNPGDTVVVETPTYIGLLQILQALGLKALEVSTDPDEGLCLECLQEAIERERVSACVLVATFGNPLGHCMPEENRRRLAEMLADAKIPIIEDDVYGEIHFDPARPKAIKAFDRNGGVMLCSSFSKTLAPGYRVGWVAPGRFLPEVEQQKYITSVASPTPTQMAIATYLEGARYDRHLRRLRSAYCGLVAKVSSTVADTFPSGTRITRPRGGHVLWVELPEGIDTIALYERAVALGITFAPGPMFTACCGYENFLRLNCAVPWSESVEAALSTLGRLAVETD